MQHRPALLFVTPTFPATTGNGLAMRAGVFLDALAYDYDVTLLVVPVAGGADSRASPFVTKRAQRVIVMQLDRAIDPLWTLIGRVAQTDARAAAFASYPRPAPCRYATAAFFAQASGAIGGAHFDAVHVMRSYMAPYAEPFLPSSSASVAPYASLDLDDDEVTTHLRLALLAERRGRAGDTALLRAEAMKYKRHEATWLPRFQLLIACTEAHRCRIATLHAESRSMVVPNTVALPVTEQRQHTAAHRLLFVGNLSYQPNVDGIADFIREVLRLLHARFEGLMLRVAGSTPVGEILALASLPGVEVIADPVEITSSYAWADVAVIPLAAGGGTRIKLLEAFAHGVPVVATSIGAEGVDALHATHLLIADEPAAFADACVLLLSDRQYANRLASAGRELVDTRYSHAVGVRIIREALARR